MKEPKILGNSLSEGSVVGQVAISDYKIESVGFVRFLKLALNADFQNEF